MKWIVVLCMIMVVAVIGSPDVYADGVKIQPTTYKETLKVGEKKKGYVDISNPGDKPVTVRMSVSGFRQTDDKGGLEFRRDEQIESGLKLDLDTVELAPRDVLRLFFVADGAMLPSGDVFAAIFAETVPNARGESTGSQIGARVGTLLFLQNGTPAAHSAVITDLDAPWLHIGEGISLSMIVKNTAPETDYTGFFPEITVDTGRYGIKKVDGPLVFSGRSRQITYMQAGNMLGPVKLRTAVGDNTRESWIFLVTGYWRWAVPLILALMTTSLAAFILLRKRR